MEDQNVKLPGKVLAFKLLDGATISENQQQMCLKLANDLTFNSMKSTLKRILSDKTNKKNQFYVLIRTLNLGGKLILKIK